MRILAWLLLAGGAALSQAETGKLEITVQEKGQPLPCRIHLSDAAGKPLKAGTLPFWRDHFVCPGAARLDLAAGKYGLEVERGPEYSSASATVTVEAGGERKQSIELKRLVDLSAEGWWSGDLHVHRPPEDIELLMRAEDLHVAPVITWWNQRNLWVGKEPPADLLVRFDGNRFAHLMAGEDEREGGALLYFDLKRPLAIAGAGREAPSPMKFLKEARGHPGLHVDIEKPFWWDVPVWLASGQVDTIGLANNHMCRSTVYATEAWGRPRDAGRLPPPLGNGFWTQEIYYHLLSCGLRVPPSAGSASGVLPNPVGYNRVYVRLDGPPDYAKWMEGLRAGRTFVTNGPLLRLQANGRWPGHVFAGREGEEFAVELKGSLSGRDEISEIQIVHNGKVERAVPAEEFARTGSLGRLTFASSGWFLVRCQAPNRNTFRFASTAPWYVEIGPAKSRISKASARFFLDWVEDRIKRVKVDDPKQREEVLEFHFRAKEFWEGVLKKANAE